MNKLDNIKPGDRVRVTFEGVVEPRTKTNPFRLVIDGQEGGNEYVSPFRECEINAPTFHIEKIDPPLVVGDRVAWDGGSYYYEIIAIRGDFAFVWNQERGLTNQRALSSLKKVPA